MDFEVADFVAFHFRCSVCFCSIFGVLQHFATICNIVKFDCIGVFRPGESVSGIRAPVKFDESALGVSNEYDGLDFFEAMPVKLHPISCRTYLFEGLAMLHAT